MLVAPSLDATTPPDKVASAPPLFLTQSYTFVKVGVPLLVEILTSSCPPAELPITISHTSTSFTGLLKV